MHLHDYLQTEGALTVAELRLLIKAGSDAQIRQWRHGYAGRLPSPENSMALEIATNGAVMRWDSRPKDWYRIWPQLIGAKGAPKVPALRAQPAPATPTPEAA